MARRRKPIVFVVSDGRGETASQVVRAAAVQFDSVDFKLVVKPNVRTVRRIETIVDQAARAGATIFYSLVDDESRRSIRRRARELSVRNVDVLGPAFTALHHLFDRKRGQTPGLLYTLERERIDRMDAVDYTLKHDDGRHPEDLDLADVVIVGVSRASKSATCFYLAYTGVRAANVPLIPGIEIPDQLLELPQHKVVGLRVELSRLLAVRETRASNMRLPDFDPYTERRSVAAELSHATRSMDRYGWRSVNVSYLAVEEIADEVMRLAQG